MLGTELVVGRESGGAGICQRYVYAGWDRGKSWGLCGSPKHQLVLGYAQAVNNAQAVFTGSSSGLRGLEFRSHG